MEWLWIVLAAVIVAAWLVFAAVASMRAAVRRSGTNDIADVADITDPPRQTKSPE